MIRLGQRLPMAALAGVGSYSIVFHTKIARSSRRACNFMIRKGECAPAVFSIPIARSTFRCFPLAFVLGEVPYHLDVVETAITAGKHVYCEWPLGNGLAEAQELARLAKEKDVLGVVGMQACLSPEILYMKQLIADGFVGEVLSTTLIARGGGWGGEIPEKKSHAYLLDNTNGATMLTIPVGHALAGLQAVLGDVENVSAVLATRRSTALVVDSGEKLPVTAPDQVLVSGVLTGGAPVSLHYRGGMPRDRAGLLWEINGTEGDLRITGPFGHLQFALKSPSAAVIAARTWLSDWVNFR